MKNRNLPPTAFVDPTGANRESVTRFVEDAARRMVDLAARAADRPPLPRDVPRIAGVIPDEPRPDAELLDELVRLLAHAMNPAHPGYMAHMDPMPATASVIAALGTAFANNNMLSVELSPLFSHLEEVVTREIAARAGLGDGAGGTLTGGGSVANLTALAVARNTAFDVADTGLHGLERTPVFFASEVSHTSLQKAAMLLGVGRRALVLVPADARDRMRPDALEAAIDRARGEGKAPFAVVATAGTTTTGSIDPIDAVADIARRERLWLHVDAAYGGAALFSRARRELLSGIDRADSVTFNPQKWLYVTKTCAMVLFADRRRWIDAMRTPLPYMDGAVLNLGEVGVQGTRHPDVLKLWATLQHLGLAGCETLVDEGCRLAGALATGLDERPFIRLATPPVLNIVCFRGEPEDVPPSGWDEWNAGLAEHLLRSCGAACSLPTYRGARWLKAVVTNPFADETHVARWLAEVDAFAHAARDLDRTVNVHLVDGTFELFRCFHGAPRASASDGCEVGAVRGLLFTLVALLRRPDVTHVAIAFDQMAGRARPGPGASDDALLRSQYMTAVDAVRALGITLWPMHRYPADDALATGAARHAADPRVERIVLCTTDKDLLQCVRGDRVVLLDRIRDRITDEAAVRARFGVGPSLIPDLFALVGDPSDGLPGVPRWGPKASAALLTAYGSIERIPDDAASWTVSVRGAAALAESLRRHRREALVMRELSVLRDDLPIPDTLDDLEWRGADRPALESLVARIGGAEALERVARLEP